MPEGSTLQDLHELIQREMDLDNDHLWAFSSPNELCGDEKHRWLSRDARSEGVVRLARLLEKTGREAEARALMQREKARQRELEARIAGTFVREAPKVGRNDPCACGSGKKAKKCCGAAD